MCGVRASIHGAIDTFSKYNLENSHYQESFADIIQIYLLYFY